MDGNLQQLITTLEDIYSSRAMILSKIPHIENSDGSIQLGLSDSNNYSLVYHADVLTFSYQNKHQANSLPSKNINWDVTFDSVGIHIRFDNSEVSYRDSDKTVSNITIINGAVTQAVYSRTEITENYDEGSDERISNGDLSEETQESLLDDLTTLIKASHPIIKALISDKFNQHLHGFFTTLNRNVEPGIEKIIQAYADTVSP